MSLLSGWERRQMLCKLQQDTVVCHLMSLLLQGAHAMAGRPRGAASHSCSAN